MADPEAARAGARARTAAQNPTAARVPRAPTQARTAARAEPVVGGDRNDAWVVEPHWRQWVAVNLARGAGHDELAAALVEEGVPDADAFAKVDLFDNPFAPDSARRTLARKESTRFEALFDFDEVRRSGMFVSDLIGRVYFDIVLINLGLDSEYNQKGYIFQIQDITKRREVEIALREKERELLRSQKMEAIGSLASGIAHDFNNILTPIMGYTDMILESSPQSETLHEYMSEVLTASHRAKDLVNQIL